VKAKFGTCAKYVAGCILMLSALAIGKGPRITTIEEAKIALGGTTYEWEDRTGLEVNIPVITNRVSFDKGVNTCTTTTRPVTEDQFSEPRSGKTRLSVARYIDTGEQYVGVECEMLGWPIVLDGPDRLSIKYGPKQYWLAKRK